MTNLELSLNITLLGGQLGNLVVQFLDGAGLTSQAGHQVSLLTVQLGQLSLQLLAELLLLLEGFGSLGDLGLEILSKSMDRVISSSRHPVRGERRRARYLQR